MLTRRVNAPADAPLTPCRGATYLHRGRTRRRSLLVVLLCLAIGIALPQLALFAYIGGMAGLIRLISMRFAQLVSPPTMTKGGYRVEPERLVLDAAGIPSGHSVPRSLMVEGWIEPVARAHTVVLRLRNGDMVCLRVDYQEEADALLDALGFGVDRRVMRARLAHGASQLTGGDAIAALMAVVLIPMLVLSVSWVLSWALRWGFLGPPTVANLAFILATFALSAFLVSWVTRKLAAVGRDGVVVRELVGYRTVPYAEVSDVIRTWQGLALILRDGSRVSLPVDKRSANLPTTKAEMLQLGPRAYAKPSLVLREALLERIQSAMRARRVLALGSKLDALDRHGRSAEDYRDALRSLAEDHGGYRGAGLTREDLLDVVGDPQVTPARRVAAAYALSTDPDAAVRLRVEEIAETFADDALRARIESAVKGELQ